MSFRDEGECGPGLPVRDCAGSPNNPASRCPKLSAIDVTAKAIFEHFVFGSRTAPICALYHHSLCIHTPTAHSAAISRFSAFSSKKVPRVAPQFLCQQVIWQVPVPWRYHTRYRRYHRRYPADMKISMSVTKYLRVDLNPSKTKSIKS